VGEQLGVFLQKPSDLGFSDDGYELPDLTVRTHMVPANPGDAGEDRDGQGRLIKTAATGVVDTAREARDTIDVRVAKVAEIVAASPDDHFILWHDLEDERKALAQVAARCGECSARRSWSATKRSPTPSRAASMKRIAAKPSMLGAGRNFQHHCHRATIFPTYKFHDFLQALHRIYRFMQPHEVVDRPGLCRNAGEQLRELMRKWEDHKSDGRAHVGPDPALWAGA
jgi:hypothetical protein